jgi:hypothetical protein
MEANPDFFLSAAGEMRADLATVRACWSKGRLRDDVRDDYMLSEVDPPVIGQEYGLGDQDIRELIISTHFRGFTLFPVTEWPSHVYVGRMLDPSVAQTLVFTASQVELIGWAMIFPTRAEAEAQVAKFDDSRGA